MDRINKINRIDRIFSVKNRRDRRWCFSMENRRDRRKTGVVPQTPPKADLNSPVSPALPA